MIDIEAKALALVNDCGGDVLVVVRNGNAWVEALCRAIEQHEAFKQEVSDAAEAFIRGDVIWQTFGRFIIPKPKPDPLVRVINEVIYAQPQGPINEATMAKEIRAALEALGFEIREKGQ